MWTFVLRTSCVPDEHSEFGGILWCRTRSTIEVAHFRSKVSEWQGPLTQNRRNANFGFEKMKVLAYLGHGLNYRDPVRL